jgi:hypothetical protein
LLVKKLTDKMLAKVPKIMEMVDDATFEDANGKTTDIVEMAGSQVHRLSPPRVPRVFLLLQVWGNSRTPIMTTSDQFVVKFFARDSTSRSILKLSTHPRPIPLSSVW